MSRKRDNRDEKNVGCVIAATVGVFVLTIVIMIFQSIPVVLPPLFLIAFLINYLLWRNNDKINAVNLRFWLDESEKKRFIELADALNYFEKKKTNAENAAVNEGVRVNKNGRLSARSYRGQELQGAIDESSDFIMKNQPIYENYQRRPLRRWKSAKKHYSKAFAFGISILIWSGYFFVNADNVKENVPRYVSEIGDTANAGFSFIGGLWSGKEYKPAEEDSVKVEKKQSEDTKQEQDISISKNPYDEFVDVYWLSTILMVGAYFIAWIIGIIVFRIKYKKPPFVSYNNVGTYA